MTWLDDALCYVTTNNAIYFDFFGVKDIPKDIKNIIGNKI